MSSAEMTHCRDDALPKCHGTKKLTFIVSFIMDFEFQVNCRNFYSIAFVFTALHSPITVMKPNANAKLCRNTLYWTEEFNCSLIKLIPMMVLLLFLSTESFLLSGPLNMGQWIDFNTSILGGDSGELGYLDYY